MTDWADDKELAGAAAPSRVGRPERKPQAPASSLDRPSAWSARLLGVLEIAVFLRQGQGFTDLARDVGDFVGPAL